MFQNLRVDVLDTLREQIALTIAQAKAHELPVACVRLGIQSAVEPDDDQESFRSKRVYVRKRLLTWNEADLVALAQRVLREYASDDLADTVSEMTVHAEHRVGELVRRDVLKALHRLPTLFGDLPLLDSLRDVFGVSAIPYDTSAFLGSGSLQERIEHHYIFNETDWSHEMLLNECGVLTCSQSRFFALLSKLLHPVVRRDGEQAELAAAFRAALRRDGFDVQQAGTESGYAVYGVVRANTGVTGAMKNLIFASIGEKPELIIRDAVNNDVEIVKHADKVLVFDRPLPSSGRLLWKDLRDWYADLYGIDEAGDAKDQLFRRLRHAVHGAQSPGELALFQGYYERYGAKLGERLPALIPQVYLHYDPYTRRHRGDEQVLVRQRMDFLMLLEQGVRIVIEIDGRQHYGIKDGKSPDRFIASAQRYAEMIAEDRRLRLAGYEVYRFGGYEFLDVDLQQRKIGPESLRVVSDFLIDYCSGIASPERPNPTTVY